MSGLSARWLVPGRVLIPHIVELGAERSAQGQLVQARVSGPSKVTVAVRAMSYDVFFRHRAQQHDAPCKTYSTLCGLSLLWTLDTYADKVLS
jgi:hypothetical protein